MSNPYQSPETSSRPSKIRNGALRRGCFGVGLGLFVGLGWSAIFGPFTDGPPSLALSFLVYTSGFALTGLLIGLVDRAPAAVGALAGIGILTLWAVIVGPKDGWIVIWVVIFGGSGLIWGTVMGCIWLGIRRRIAA